MIDLMQFLQVFSILLLLDLRDMMGQVQDAFMLTIQGKRKLLFFL